MTEESCQIQLTNQIKFGSRSLRSIRHELAHDFHSNSSLVDKYEITVHYTTKCKHYMYNNMDDELCSITNHYLDYHYAPGNFLQAKLIIGHT